MTDKEIIEKATNALKALELLLDYNDISVYEEVNQMVLEMAPEKEHTYSVLFGFNPPVRGAGASVSVDRKTHKLLRIVTKNGMYKVPEELQ